MENSESNPFSTNKTRDWIAVVFALILPSLVTLAYFIWAKGSAAAVQQTVYAVAKVIQFAFPVVWVAFIQRNGLKFGLKSTRGVGLGLLFGLATFVAALALYHGWLKSTEFFLVGREAMLEKISDLGVTESWKFIALGVFYSLIHSLLEEYYWRWFVFRQLKCLISLWPAIVISSLGFMAHHVIVIGTYFGFFSAATWLLSLAVAVGGVFWAWLYHRTDSLLGPWVSHLIIDAAIFIMGYDIAIS